jgi:hypothetical protein
MRTRRVSLLMGLVCFIASATAIAQTPDINGRIYGIEFCAQSASICDSKAQFVGTFIGKVGELRDTSAAWYVAVTHESPLNETNNGTTKVTGGYFSLVLKGDVSISGTIDPGGTLTYHAGNNTFDVDLTLTITQGGKAKVDVTLNHGVFPPTVTGRMRSQ